MIGLIHENDRSGVGGRSPPFRVAFYPEQRPVVYPPLNPTGRSILLFAKEMHRHPIYLTIISIGSIGLLWSMLDVDLDFRGANDFIRPFHAVGLLVTVLVAAFIFKTLCRVGSAILTSRPALQTAMYLVTSLVVWYFVLPLGDWAAVQWERAHKTAAEVGDMGYGWNYWDDSGMGGDPMRIGHLLRSAIVMPLLPLLWLTLCYLVLRLANASTITTTPKINNGEPQR